MGSLLPGWDERSPGIAPKEYQDFKEDADEDQGYFAAYAKLKKLQKEAGQSSSPIAIASRNSSLARRSSTSGDVRASPRALLSRNSMPGTSAHEWAVTSPVSGRSLPRAETMAARPNPPSGSDSCATRLQLHRMYSMPLTRGEQADVVLGLTPGSPSGTSSGASHSLDAYKTQQADKDKKTYQWWRHLDSAVMNERPDEPIVKEKGYTPQYNVTGQGIRYAQDATHRDAGPSVVSAH